MIQEQAKILSNQKIADQVYKMEIETTLSSQSAPGQFVEIQVPGYYLRRPISICEIQEGILTIIYKVLGDGTKVMSKMKAGETIDLFGPCGTGFPIENRDTVLLAGGGVGVPPLYECAKQYRNKNTNVQVVLGFNSKKDVFYVDEFEQLGCQVYVSTMDGSFGVKGTIMDALKEHAIEPDFVLACGPLPMLKAIDASAKEGYVSLEARMACGIGACMGCVVELVEGGMARVCKDGPVFPVGKVKL